MIPAAARVSLPAEAVDEPQVGAADELPAGVVVLLPGAAAALFQVEAAVVPLDEEQAGFPVSASVLFQAGEPNEFRAGAAVLSLDEAAVSTLFEVAAELLFWE